MKPIRISHDFYQVLPGEIRSSLEMFYLADREFWLGCSAVSFPRYGRSTVWDFHIDRDYVCSPALNQSYNKSFSEVTDQRAEEIRQDMRRYNCELVVCWSGGIDSTLILASLVKNFSRNELANVTVLANNESYFENPVFYHNIIEKYQLKTVNFRNFSNEKVQSLFDTHLVIDGEPADKLWIVNVALQFESMYGSGILKKPLKDTADKFIEYLTQYMTNDQAREYYDYLMQNINEAQINIDTTGDLFWWINFNFHWIEHLLIWYYQFPVKSAAAYAQFKKHYKPWYNTVDYQQWSLADRPKSIPDDHGGLYKMPAKQYINELSKDDFYCNYKSKLGSAKDFSTTPDDLVILEDGSRLDYKDKKTLDCFIEQNLIR